MSKKKLRYRKNKKKKVDKHIACPSYPVCEEAPLGCVVQQGIGNVEWYGHKD